MSRVIDNVVISFKGVFEFETLYKQMRKWFKDRNYVVTETIYKDKAASPFGHEVEWRFNPEKQVTQYVKYKIEIFFKFEHIKEMNANIKGKDKKVTEGKAKLTIVHAEVEYDWQNKFSGEWTSKLKKFMHKTFKMYYAIKYEDPLYQEIKDFQTSLKKILDMNAT